MQLAVDRLQKQYKKKTAVAGVTFTLERGVCGLLGANGAGKTTLMRLLCGLVRPTAGTVRFDGVDVRDEAYRDLLGYMPQQFGFYPEFTAAQYLACVAAAKGLPEKPARKRSLELLEQVNLIDVADRKVKTYSGGMKQRLGIAQALLNDPKIVVFDEPTAGLDPKERIKFKNIISQLSADRIVLLSTHILSDIEDIAVRVLIMRDGHLIENGDTQSLIENVCGKVFECVLPPGRADELAKNFCIVNRREQVSGPKSGVLLRILADAPPCEEAAAVPATLDDLYLYHFQDAHVQHEVFRRAHFRNIHAGLLTKRGEP